MSGAILIAVGRTRMSTTATKEYIYTPSGVSVSVISVHDEGEYLMVKSTTTGKVFFAHKNQVTEKDTGKKEGEIHVKRRRGRPSLAPAVAAPTRFNINTATPELLTQVLKGVGMKTAVEIKELQQSLPGERFSKLDQIKSIGGVDWDEVLSEDVVYVE